MLGSLYTLDYCGDGSFYLEVFRFYTWVMGPSYCLEVIAFGILLHVELWGDMIKLLSAVLGLGYPICIFFNILNVSNSLSLLLAFSIPAPFCHEH